MQFINCGMRGSSVHPNASANNDGGNQDLEMVARPAGNNGHFQGPVVQQPDWTPLMVSVMSPTRLLLKVRMLTSSNRIPGGSRITSTKMTSIPSKRASRLLFAVLSEAMALPDNARQPNELQCQETIALSPRATPNTGI